MKKLLAILSIFLVWSVSFAGTPFIAPQTSGENYAVLSGTNGYYPDDTFYNLDGINDTISRSDLSDSSAGAAYYIHPTTGELVTVPSGTPLNHPTLGLTGFGNYEQVCQDSQDPGDLTLFVATRSATGNTFGPFTEYNIIDDGAVWNRIQVWQSNASGAPGAIMYGVIRYNPGTSGEIRLTCTTGGQGDSVYQGEIGSASITQSLGGTLVVFSDLYDEVLGYYILKFSMVFSDLNAADNIGIGPNSTDNSSIKVLGADVSEDRAILDFHVPSSGSNVSIGSRAGTITAPFVDFPKLELALEGPGGNDAAATHQDVWTPGHDYDVAGATAGTLMESGNFLTGYTNTGDVYLTDGTNTATVAGVNWASGVPLDIKVVYGDYLGNQKMQITVDGVSSAITTFLDSFFPDTELTYLDDTDQNSINNHRVRVLNQSDWMVP